MNVRSKFVPPGYPDIDWHIERQRHVLSHDAESQTTVTFAQYGNGEDPEREWEMQRQDWEAMGSPERITITVEPGDLLNDSS